MTKPKVANAGLRVLEMLKILVQKPLTLNEIINLNELNINTENVYAKETISKYFNTLRSLGFVIEKSDNKFYLRTNIDKLHLEPGDIKIFNLLRQYSKSLHRCEFSTNLNELFKIIENSLDKPSAALLSKSSYRNVKIGKSSVDQSERIVQRYENYCKDRLKLKIRYRFGSTLKTLKVEPRNIIFKKSKVFLLAYNYIDNEYMELLIQNIENALQLPQLANENNYLNPVSFKLKGELAKVYVLREGEKLAEMDKESITVLNSTEDRERLMHRLLRYKEDCEVRYPKSFRQKFIDYTQSIIDKYE